jgi:hypothetical protein
MVERFNRTLKTKLDRIKKASGTKTITNILPEVVDTYNKDLDHSTIKMTPEEAKMPENKSKVSRNILDRAKITRRPRIKAGDRVRVLLKQKSWAKGYAAKWSPTLYD